MRAVVLGSAPHQLEGDALCYLGEGGGLPFVGPCRHRPHGTEAEDSGPQAHREPVGQILARGKRATRAGDDDGADHRIRRAVRDGGGERPGEGVVERVQNVRTVEREDGHRAVALDAHGGAARHLPLKIALRLFTKASTPSFLSSVANKR